VDATRIGAGAEAYLVGVFRLNNAGQLLRGASVAQVHCTVWG